MQFQPKFTETKEIQSIIDLYIKEKYTIKSIAKKFNCSWITIKKVLQKNNILFRKVREGTYVRYDLAHAIEYTKNLIYEEILRRWSKNIKINFYHFFVVFIQVFLGSMKRIQIFH